MCRFSHPNVMHLIGVCVVHGNSGTGPYVVMPFMARGSLLDFLRKEDESLFVENEGNPLVTTTLNLICGNNWVITSCYPQSNLQDLSVVHNYTGYPDFSVSPLILCKNFGVSDF